MWQPLRMRPGDIYAKVSLIAFVAGPIGVIISAIVLALHGN